MFFQNNIDSFLLASSDSDYWGLIPAMPQARYYVLVEAEKCSGAIRKAMENGGIAFVNSPCPDHLCEGFGIMQNAGDWAACMPARTSITIEEK